jgi:tetratricopeptide (TPR) repeat protein
VLRADTLVARKSYDLAAVSYRRALELQPNYVHVLNKLGMCYQRAGRLNDAWKAYEDALRVDPAYAAVWNNMGSIAHSRHDYTEAVRRYERAIALKPDLAPSYKNLGTAYFALEDEEKGFEAYLAAYKLDASIFQSPGGGVRGQGIDPALQNFFIAKIYAAAGQLELALEFLRRARDAGFDEFERVRHDPHLGVLIDDPRYQEIVAGEAAPGSATD